MNGPILQKNKNQYIV